jgi:hypothetical protein
VTCCAVATLNRDGRQQFSVTKEPADTHGHLVSILPHSTCWLESRGIVRLAFQYAIGTTPQPMLGQDVAKSAATNSS